MSWIHIENRRHISRIYIGNRRHIYRIHIRNRRHISRIHKGNKKHVSRKIYLEYIKKTEDIYLEYIKETEDMYQGKNMTMKKMIDWLSINVSRNWKCDSLCWQLCRKWVFYWNQNQGLGGRGGFTLYKGRGLLYTQPKVRRKSSSLHISAEFRLGSYISLFRSIL